MLAIDTNLLVRYLTGDHPTQSAQARALIDGEDVFVGTTVLLEAEWVLRRAYEFTAAQLAKALRGFAGLARVTLEEPGLAAQALNWLEAGMDFADALHLAKANGCDAFVTFDRHFLRTASKLGTMAVRLP
jgi:predicted nucleic-acid-binding protein